MAGSNAHTSLQMVRVSGKVQQGPWERSVRAAIVLTCKVGAPCAMNSGIVPSDFYLIFFPFCVVFFFFFVEMELF